MTALENIGIATLAVAAGVFELEVLGYQFPASSEPFDKDWLLVRAVWNGTNLQARQVGPFVLTSDLERWTDGLIVVSESGCSSELQLGSLEPNLAITCRPSGVANCVEMTISIRGDAIEGCVEVADITFEVDHQLLGDFAASLSRLALRFPPR